MVYAPLLVGCTTIAFEGALDHPTPDANWRAAVEEFGVTGIFSSPTAIRMLMRYGNEPLRSIDYSRLEPPPPWAAAEHVFCALGTTMRQAGSEEAFRRVDFDYPVALARATVARGARHFLLVSAVGASTNSRFFYNRVKGEVEAAIIALGFHSLTVARPSLLLGDRGTFRWVEQVGKVAGVLAPARWRPVAAESVARALIAAARRDEPGVRILENTDLRGGG